VIPILLLSLRIQGLICRTEEPATRPVSLTEKAQCGDASNREASAPSDVVILNEPDDGARGIG